MKKRSLLTLLATLAVAGLTSFASAGVITYVGPLTTTLNPDNLSGTGKGVVLGVLSLDVTGGTETTPPGPKGEAGSTGVTGGGTLTFSSQAEFSSGSQIFDTNHFFARSVLELKNAGFTDPNALAVVFQPNQSGHDPTKDSIHVTTFSVLYMDKNGNVLQTDTYTSIDTGDPANPSATAPADFVGVGQGTSGYFFDLANAPAGFYNDNTNYIGMIVHTTSGMTNADDGSDNFFLTTGPQVGVPVPAAAWTGMTALAGLGVVGKLRKKLNRG
jgi:hypothetical protein